MHKFDAASESKATTVPLIIGVTSHRNIPAREMEPIRQRVREFLARLQRDFPLLPLVVLSSLAEGGDQWVAEEALAAGVRLVAPLPMTREQYAHDFTDPAALARYQGLCDAADVIEVPHIGSSTLDRRGEAPVGSERDLHYAQAGVYISQHCHVLLAIWDGKMSDRVGGTAQVVRFHLAGIAPALDERRRGFPRSALLGNDSERLAYHIVCSRDEADGAPLAPLQPLQALWRLGERAVPGDERMPLEFESMFVHATAFVDDWRIYAPQIDAPQPYADSVSNDGNLGRLFRTADWLAIHFQRRVLLSMRTISTLAALMGVALMAYSDLPNQDNMIYVFLALFAVGIVVSQLATRRSWHRKYLDYRALAEGLRVQSYWRRAGLSLTGDAEFGRDNFLQKQDVELGWIRNVMRGAALEGAIDAQPCRAGDLPLVIGEWIGDGNPSGQLGYYARKAAQRTRTLHVTETLGAASWRVGIGISVLLALFVRQLGQDAKTDLVALMAVLSIIAAVREAYAYKKADKELIKQYRFMQRIFGEAHRALTRTSDVAEQRDILRMLGEAAMAEHVEWALMHRERPLEHGKL
jgi:hypothetical protein